MWEVQFSFFINNHPGIVHIINSGSCFWVYGHWFNNDGTASNFMDLKSWILPADRQLYRMPFPGWRTKVLDPKQAVVRFHCTEANRTCNGIDLIFGNVPKLHSRQHKSIHYHSSFAYLLSWSVCLSSRDSNILLFRPFLEREQQSDHVTSRPMVRSMDD